ncbi:MAG: serine acetyltransferase [Prevotella sp.]|nr:serine acetyltransferase [Prevotella sp.]
MRAVDSTDVVMLGNGLVEYAGDWNILLGWKHIRNRGIATEDANGLWRRLNTVTAGHPQAIFIMVGQEDILNGATVEETYNQCVQILHFIKTRCPKTKLFVQSNLPVCDYYNADKLKGKSDKIAVLNVKLRNYCKQRGLAYINLYKSFIRHGTTELRRELTTDGQNLSAFGYRLWAFELKKYLLQLSSHP